MPSILVDCRHVLQRFLNQGTEARNNGEREDCEMARGPTVSGDKAPQDSASEVRVECSEMRVVLMLIACFYI